ncbi:hypothetical protein B0H17DRAFT_1089302 [Mycena rosella]|uniref:Uncharacterized protein n=1 Tax=Mycena rosella TaxID=1033263 RepID=A0AAD7CW61_MYCRO|nr:hypothetical protein B0H17DRAFT_1089302 [Mycena rosella]
MHPYCILHFLLSALASLTPIIIHTNPTASRSLASLSSRASDGFRTLSSAVQEKLGSNRAHFALHSIYPGCAVLSDVSVCAPHVCFSLAHILRAPVLSAVDIVHTAPLADFFSPVPVLSTSPTSKPLAASPTGLDNCKATITHSATVDEASEPSAIPVSSLPLSTSSDTLAAHKVVEKLTVDELPPNSRGLKAWQAFTVLLEADETAIGAVIVAAVIVIWALLFGLRGPGEVELDSDVAGKAKTPAMNANLLDLVEALNSGERVPPLVTLAQTYGIGVFPGAFKGPSAITTIPGIPRALAFADVIIQEGPLTAVTSWIPSPVLLVTAPVLALAPAPAPIPAPPFTPAASTPGPKSTAPGPANCCVLSGDASPSATAAAGPAMPSIVAANGSEPATSTSFPVAAANPATTPIQEETAAGIFGSNVKALVTSALAADRDNESPCMASIMAPAAAPMAVTTPGLLEPFPVTPEFAAGYLLVHRGDERPRMASIVPPGGEDTLESNDLAATPCPRVLSAGTYATAVFSPPGPLWPLRFGVAVVPDSAAPFSSTPRTVLRAPYPPRCSRPNRRVWRVRSKGSGGRICSCRFCSR